MPDALMARLWAGLLATSPLEAVAVLSSLIYVTGVQEIRFPELPSLGFVKRRAELLVFPHFLD
jgi:hypothetical protein